MNLQLGEIAPDFTADTTEGRINFHEWLGDSWAMLFSHPRTSPRSAPPNWAPWRGWKPEFDKRNIKVIGLSVDPVDNHVPAGRPTSWSRRARPRTFR